MKKILLLVVSVSAAYISNGQNSLAEKFTYKNSIELDLGGPGLYYSVNYERILINQDKFKTTAQAGAAYYPNSTGITNLWLPVLINELVSFGPHHAEFGIGHIFTKDRLFEADLPSPYKQWQTFMTFKAGYRYQKPDGRFLFKAAFTPIIEYPAHSAFYPTGGLTFGYNF